MQKVAKMGNDFSKHKYDYTGFLFHLEMSNSAAECGRDNFDVVLCLFKTDCAVFTERQWSSVIFAVFLVLFTSFTSKVCGEHKILML